MSPPCTNAECSSNEGDGDVPCTFVEAPQEYPGESDEYSAQVVCTIDIPGLSCLAQKNGEAICWLRNNAEALLRSVELLLNLREAIDFVSEYERHQGWPVTVKNADDLVTYAESLGWRRQ